MTLQRQGAGEVSGVGRGDSGAPQVEHIPDLESARALGQEWDELADAAGVGPLSRPAYALTWWEHLGSGRLLVTVAREHGRLVALAGLHERRVGPVTVARWLGHGLGTVAQPLVRPGHEEAARALGEALARPGRVLQLVECRADAVGLEQVAAVGARGRRTRVTPRDVCPVADLEGDDGLALLQRPAARNLRSNLARADRRLVAAGLGFRVEVLDDVAALEARLPEILGIHDAAEAAQPRQHLLRPPYDGFLLGYMRTEIGAGRAVAFLGYVADRPAAFRFALCSGDTLSLTLTRFDPALSDYRPGHLLWREVYRWAAGRGLRRVDLLLGASQTKKQWSTGSYDTVDVTSGTPAALALAHGALRAAAVGDRIATGVAAWVGSRVTARVRPKGD